MMGHPPAKLSSDIALHKSDCSAQKAILRRRMRVIRRDIPLQKRHRHEARLCAQLLAWPLLAQAQRVAVYYPFGHEANIWPWAQNAAAAGKAIYLPGRHQKVEAGFFELRPDALPPIFSPGVFDMGPQARPAQQDELDLILLPGLAADFSGNRLGYGGGWYDTLLAKMGGDSPRGIVLFEEQMVETVPSEPWDIPIQFIITPERLIDLHADG